MRTRHICAPAWSARTEPIQPHKIYTSLSPPYPTPFKNPPWRRTVAELGVRAVARNLLESRSQ